MDKETLLALWVANFERLTQALEGVPQEDLAETFDHTLVQALDLPAEVDPWSVKAICALLTAWDGEILRRLNYQIGALFYEPHDWHDSTYWSAWGFKQLEIKQVRSMQGVLVDMVGTRQRLLGQLAELNDFQFDHWLEADPQAKQAYYIDYVSKIERWRQVWENRPPESRLKKLWRNVKRRFGD
jgi:hypothetical protein